MTNHEHKLPSKIALPNKTNVNLHNKYVNGVSRYFFKQKWYLNQEIADSNNGQHNKLKPQPIINNSSGSYTRNKAAVKALGKDGDRDKNIRMWKR